MKSIIFGIKKFDGVLCLDANLPPMECIEKLSGIPVIAADGAAIRLSDSGIIPEYIVGDLDTFYSYKHPEKFKTSKIIQLVEQETNDFEKALNLIINLNLKDILIIGFHGGELEHTLNNWSVLIKFSKILNLCILDGNRYAIPVSESICINAESEEIVSIIPQPKATLSTKNLKWELKNETLELGKREGARNLVIDKEIEIELHDGSYLLFIAERLPFPPVFKYLY